MTARPCPQCKSTAVRRLTRHGWLECYLLTWLGYYPWECVVCRRKTYLRDPGKRASDRGYL